MKKLDFSDNVNKAIVIVAGCCIVAVSCLSTIERANNDLEEASGRIIIVSASRMPTPVPSSPPNPHGVTTSVTPDIVAMRVSATYPVLTNVAVQCDYSHCTLSGVIGRPASLDDQDRQQAMLVGGLHAFLASSGFEPTSVIQLDEVGDEERRLHVTLPRWPDHARPAA